MAFSVGTIMLPIPGGLPPSGVQACAQKVVTSSSTPSNGAAARFTRLQFSSTTDEHWLWTVRIPDNFSSFDGLLLRHGCDAATGGVAYKASLCPVVDGTDDLDSIATNTVWAGLVIADVADLGGVGFTSYVDVTDGAFGAGGLTDVAAGRMCCVMIGRDVADAGDTAAGDAWIVTAALYYTANNS